MRKLIYKLFFVAGICVSLFGLSNSGNATTSSPTPVTTKPAIKGTDSNEKLYFTDAIKGSDSQLYAAHYSHESHSSHYSHTSSRY